MEHLLANRKSNFLVKSLDEDLLAVNTINEIHGKSGQKEHLIPGKVSNQKQEFLSGD